MRDSRSPWPSCSSRLGSWGQTPSAWGQTPRRWGQTPSASKRGQTPAPSKRGQTPWPPPVQKVAEIVPALSADAELKTFHLPPGYHAELVASEPLVTDPIWVDFDADGRMYVLEMPGFAMDKTMADSREPIGRIAVLEDTNNDGKMDKRTVFMDGLVLPRALKVLANGVLVGEPPNLWLCKDTDGDLKADTKELVRQRLRPTRRQSRTQREQPVVGDRQLDLHVRARLVSALEERQVRGPEDAEPRPVGCRHGRRRAYLSQREHRGAVRRHRAGQLLHAQPERGAHARALRGSGRLRQDGDLAGATDARRQSRLSGRAAARRTAPPPITPASRRR